MINRFQRAVSFPIPRNNAARQASYKARSASLPVRFGPIVSNLDDHAESLKTWCCSKLSRRVPSATWLTDGITLISVLLASLSDLLNHPHATDPLRKSSVIESFSDDILRLADMYQSFRLDLINMSHLQAETCVALRQKDPTRLSSTTRAQRRAARVISKLALAARTAARTKPPPLSDITVEPEESSAVMLPVAMCYSVSVLATASSALFSGVAALSDKSVASTATIVGACNPVKNGKVMRIWWVVDLLRWKRRAKMKLDTDKKHTLERRMEREMEKRKEQKEKLENLEECLREMEISSAKIFNSLVKARVCILNMLTPT
ncbi:DUF241 domain protein (DUF241) [Rhynchospora pubera]|uniref:DUF241 domain protein (DUF241) n=1 Tax=Rhynchospora pubera TaxID=906938 RepID=A0AAV8CXU0_9POAL|nr:DUF241 domain protein (DUF241) [Rhynchospora pubera]